MSLRSPSIPTAFPRLFWCHQCRCPVRILPPPFPTSSDVFCPRCFGQFVQELDFLSPWTTTFLSDDPYYHSHLHLHHIFPPWTPPPLPPRNPSLGTRLHPDEYFVGPNLNELIEDLTQNDLPGPPPAASSSINALPTVSITAEHLREGSQCPVCKEDFVVGEEAREMPCRHVYHSDCLLPWLRLHNTCPVCRFQLPGGNSSDEEPSRDRRERQQQPGRLNPLALLTAFRSSPATAWEQRYGDDRRERGEDPIDSVSAFYSWWRSLFLL